MLAFLPIFIAHPALATDTTLEQAQEALVVAQQEVLDATAALEQATELVASSTVTRDTAQIAYNEALAAWEATKVTVPGTTSTTTQNVVQNGTFDSTANWSSVVASSTVYTGGASPIIYNGTLKGSYSSGYYIQQTGTFPSPTRQVTFSADVWNYDTNEGNRINNPDYYRIEFRTYAADGTRLNYYNIEISSWHELLTRTATYTLAQDAVRWDIGFRMADAGYWAGAFGPVIDNVSLIATMGIITPETYTYGEAETVTKLAAYQALQTTQSVLDAAIVEKTSAQGRLVAANAEVSRLQALIVSLTPPWWQVSFTEGETVSIGAPEGFKFGQPRAWYGSPTDSNCGADVSSIVNELINGRSSATFVADNGVFGDPCGGVVKVLRLSTPVDAIVAPTPIPTPQPTADPTPEPIVTPTPEVTPSPTPTPEPVPSPSPLPQPEITPTPLPQPEPEPIPTPTPTPTPSETVEPTPTPEPTLQPEPEPTLEPEPEISETPSPEPPIEEEPEPEATPEPETILPEESEAVVSELLNVEPEKLTDEQVEQLVDAAEAVLENAEQGSPEYEQALEALAVAAEADDPEIPSELAAIPLLGDVAGAALEMFNDIGNVGADMAPAVREEAEKTVIATVIAAGAAINAVQAATTAATSAATTAAASAAAPSSGSSGTSGGSSGGSSGSSARRKE